MRKQFLLPPEDTSFLDSLGLNWETLKESNSEWLIVYDYPVPKGYSITCVDVAIKIPSGYPIAPLDMAYFHPALQRLDGKQINATNCVQALDEKSWQRWSRHRTGTNAWEPGVDSIITHFISIKYWLEREFQ
ncbi:E2/UBC family protein [Prolixibacter denitrificans]|uniref:E2/UBC family protein E n=1 Tax=Prolixibacter denitrificans TaxID=1541063 RepID=A0A2P8CHP2_9BACT|nr:E2/UBC family protein [Prolixibacter denitrificans]PSK84497.1 E2/UBC family protein E [Prolixibacter denitrificans]GET20670.1 hypothetical protein JCM18694_09160 [Prolixibacter denitrificans]